jgi:carboxyl-terminal processing protease
MKSGENTVLRILIGLLLLVVIFTAFTMGQVSVAKGPESFWNYAFSTKKGTNVALVGEVLGIVKSRYYKPVEDDTQLVYGALGGMINALHGKPWEDPYSGFLDETSWNSLKATTTGSYAGIGILIGPHERQPFPVIVTVFPDSPASKAGIRENDIIVEVNGVSMQDKVLDEAAALIKGQVGTDVKLGIMREGLMQPLQITVKRQKVAVHSVTESRVLADGTGYISLAFFGETTASEVEAALQKFEKEGVKGLIIDLRNNTGGLLDAAIDVADMFVNKGDIVTVELRNQAPEVHPANPDRRKYRFAIVLLVNAYTASASEVLAGALRDYGLAVLVGEKTFGKGVVQEVYELNDSKVALALTIGRYLTPKKYDLGGSGLEPDIKVDYDQYKARDPELGAMQKKLDAKAAELRKLTDELVQRLVNEDFQLQDGQKAVKEKLAPQKKEGAA